MAGGWAWLGWVVFLRVAAAMALLPAFGSQSVPLRVRLALACAFAAVVAPAVADRVVLLPPDWPALLRYTATETLAGLSLGFSARLLLWLLHVAGTMAAQATSLAQLLGGATAEPQPAIAEILVVAGLALAAAAGLHIRVAQAFILSYDTMPAGTVPLAADLSSWAVGRVAAMFATAFTYAAPFLIASLIYNLALGAINRAMPQLMVAFVGAPAITAAGLVILLVSAPVILSLWLGLIDLRLADPFGMGP
ncbi:MAG: flagellar biosynthetic protein FliR [Rhodobacteraceae bacterium]|nr:flagellar biosynthetic protein FliR [Paracoccaceae bacterium]